MTAHAAIHAALKTMFAKKFFTEFSLLISLHSFIGLSCQNFTTISVWEIITTLKKMSSFYLSPVHNRAGTSLFIDACLLKECPIQSRN